MFQEYANFLLSPFWMGCLLGILFGVILVGFLADLGRGTPPEMPTGGPEDALPDVLFNQGGSLPVPAATPVTGPPDPKGSTIAMYEDHRQFKMSLVNKLCHLSEEVSLIRHEIYYFMKTITPVCYCEHASFAGDGPTACDPGNKTMRPAHTRTWSQVTCIPCLRARIRKLEEERAGVCKEKTT